MGGEIATTPLWVILFKRRDVMADLHISCSCFNYPDWREKFYPKGLSVRSLQGRTNNE